MENIAKIGVDLWSIVLYIFNYGLLLAVLVYFLYPRIRKAVEERQKTIADNINQAENLRKEFEKDMKKRELEREKMATQFKKEQQAMKKELEAKRNELVAEMEQKRNKMLEESNAQIKEQKNALIKETEGQITKMLQRVILSVLSNASEVDVKRSVEDAWRGQKENYKN